MNGEKTPVVQNIARLFPFIFIVALLASYLLLPTKTFSVRERRYLAQWPSFHVEDVLDGSYGRKVEVHFSDQFPLRDFWLQIYELCEGQSLTQF